MSLYNDASLVMIPSAYKDGKLYSIKPTDGSGDFTFSRGSNLAATRVDENGLIEKGRENLLLYSNQFDTTWADSGTISKTSGQSGYDGSSDAWLVTKSSASAYTYQNVSSGLATFSVYAKAGTLNWLNLLKGGNSGQYFNLSTGVLGGSYGVTPIDANIENIGGGWYRCSLTYTDAFAGSLRIYPADGNGDVSGTSGNIYIQDAQLEAGLVATDYIETTATTAQAGILEDMPRLDYSGGASCPSLLLEPTRTNLVPYSEYFGAWNEQGTASVTDNQAISPEGVQNAALLDLGATSGGFNRIDIDASISAGTDYVFSVFVKNIDADNITISNFETSNYQIATFDLVNGLNYSSTSSFIEDYGNGWWRIAFVFNTNTATTASLRIQPSLNLSYPSQGEQIYIYGAMLESGSYPTSYIPCYGAATTRSFDNGDVLDTNTFGTDGEDVTYFFEFVNNTLITRDSASTSIRVNNSASNLGSFRIYRSSSSDYRLAVVFVDNDNNFSPSGTATSTDNAKVLIKREWATGLIEVFVNGVKQLSGTSLLFNEWSKIEIEGTGSTINIKQAAVFPSVLTDSECIALTTI